MEQRLITKEQIAMHTCIKNFVWEDQSQKQCYIFHIALRGVNSAIIELETHNHGKIKSVVFTVYTDGQGSEQ